jgi:hypothetical protein
MSSLYQNLLNVGQLAGIGYDLCFKYKTCIISYEQERLITLELLLIIIYNNQKLIRKSCFALVL